MIKWYEVFGVKENEEFEIKFKNIENITRYKIVNNKVYKIYKRESQYVVAIAINEIEDIRKVKRFTAQERVILKSIDKKYIYIARDRINGLYVYEFEPKKNVDKGKWMPERTYGLEFEVFNHLFNDIKWEDYEAVCIDDVVERN